MSAQAGESVLGVHITLQLSPEPKPTGSPEDDLQNRVNFDFVKYNIIATSPNRPTNSSNPHPDDIPNLFRLIRQPKIKHMAY